MNSEHVGYAFAKIESWLEGYAARVGESYQELSLACANKFRENGKPVLTLASTAPARKRATKQADTLGRNITQWGKGQHPYWSKMTADERSKEIRRRMQVRNLNRAKLKRPMGGVA
jgi:hypothetical protein